MATSIRVEHLNKSLGSKRVLEGISLEVQPGELFFLLGPSGCGKTTLLRCVAGLVMPDSGGVYFDGQNMQAIPPEQRQAIMVFQSYALWPHLTVAQNIAFGLEVQRVTADEINQRVVEALAVVKMGDRAEARPAELSGGQQQRVALARALVVRPRCLLLDEPLSNLDAQLRLEMRAEIRHICKQAGLTTMYVTHDQKEALSMADRMAVLADGKIQQCGAPQEIYRYPANHWVAQFIGETNFIAGAVTRLEGDVARVQTKIGEISVSGVPQGKICAGLAVTLSLRPEFIQFGASPMDGLNNFLGVIHDRVYLGEGMQYRIKLAPDGECLKANGSSSAVRKLGDQVPFWFAPEDVVILSG